MLNNVLQRLGLMHKQVNIALWGSDVSEMATLVHGLQTGEYVKQEPSIHPFSQEITINNVNFTATVPSGNTGARLAWRSSLPEFDGIVYVVDTKDSSWLTVAKEELNGLLNDETLSKPILILVAKSDPSEEAELDAITKQGPTVALYTYDKYEETKEGFQWLLQHV
ncbi:GTP-binding protein SAR1a [Hypsizygus marmoreus]|uniref:GTP-binding protein SAR1a n=1 Tax=Hypsizygus marmoreus TaxID=39966 RepID=A0A369K3Y8_HYPMA|nr:GTP-binding protein SAR1a [Hypsizygus marmoreus]